MMEQFMLLHSYALYDLLRERIFNSVSHFFIFAILLKLQLHSFCFKRLLDYVVLCKLIQNLLHDAFFSGLIPFVDCSRPACFAPWKALPPIPQNDGCIHGYILSRTTAFPHYHVDTTS